MAKDQYKLIADIIDMPVPKQTTLSDCKKCTGAVFSLGYRHAKRDIIKLIQKEEHDNKNK